MTLYMMSGASRPMKSAGTDMPNGIGPSNVLDFGRKSKDKDITKSLESN